MDDLEEDNIPSFKIVLMGSSGVGKTSIINRYLKHTFDDETLTTTGICFNSKTINFEATNDSCKIDVKILNYKFYKIQIWDTAGQEKYKSITRIYYQKSDAIIFVYDITDLKSYEDLKVLYEEVKENIDISKVLVCIVGNKSDKYNLQQIKKEEAEKYAESIKGIYRCVSALSYFGIKELFESIGNELMKEYRKESGASVPKNVPKKVAKNVSLKNDNLKKDKKGGGCCK